jgi:plastocyanin
MHCHVLGHMHSTLGGGMMGSLLVIQGGDECASGPHFGLPLGEPCHGAMQPPEPGLTANVRSTAGCQWRDDTFGTPETTIKVNGTVTWFDNGCSPHTVVSRDLPGFTNWPTPLNNLAVPAAGTAPQTFPQVGDFAYICGVHGGDPALKSGMYGIIHVVP